MARCAPVDRSYGHLAQHSGRDLATVRYAMTRLIDNIDLRANIDSERRGRIGQGWRRQVLPPLLEQGRDVRRRPKQLHRLVRKRQKTFALVEASSVFIFRIDDDGERGDFASDRAVQSVSKEKTAVTLALMTTINRQTPQERGGYQGIARQLLGNLGRQLGERHRSRGQGVIAADSPILQHKDERRRHVLSGVLASLRLQIPIERFDAAVETRAIMLRAKHLDPQNLFRPRIHLSNASLLAITPNGVTQPIIHRHRIYECLDKCLAVAK